MSDETITVTTETGQKLQVLVTAKKAEAIWVLIGEGPHSIKCKLEPTRNGLAYAGSVMGRELIYQRTVEQVREELAASERQSHRHKIRW